MKKILAIGFLGLSVAGCAGKQHADTTQQPVSPVIRRIQDDLKEVSNLIVIGKVIGSKGPLVESALKREGIVCVLNGGEFHYISVPEHRKQDAIEVLTRGTKSNAYQIIWETP